MFEVPSYILSGINQGNFKRVGGVIVHSESNQVIAWLRESSIMTDQNPIMKQMGINKFSSMPLLTIGGGIIMLLVLSNIDNKLSSIKNQNEHIIKLLEENRQTNYIVSMQAADDFLRGNQNQFERAVNELYEAQLHALSKLKSGMSSNKFNLDHLYFMLDDIVEIFSIRIRCYLAYGDTVNALANLSRGKQEISDYISQLIDMFIDRPSAFFHKANSDELLNRFIEFDLLREGKSYSQANLLALVHKYRSDFWETDFNPTVIKTVSKIRSLISRNNDENHSSLAHCLQHAEMLFEHLQRLNGFELEIRSGRLEDPSFQPWYEYKEDFDEAIIIDHQAINNLTL
jgi:hypothetical protein